MKLKELWGLVKQTVSEYGDDKVPKLAAALSYYTAFSLAPLLVLAIAVAGLIFGRDAAEGTIVYQMESLIGHDGAKFIQTAIANTTKDNANTIATVISLITLAITASAAFLELQDSLNIIWKVRAKPGQAIAQFIRNRLISFGLIVAVGFLLLVSLVISAALSALGTYIGSLFAVPPLVLELVNLVISLGVVWVLFSLIYMVLPDVKLSWKDVRLGALVTTLLFTIGRYLVGLYLGSGSVGTTFGAAGSLAILLVWVYYSAQIVFLGAEFTYVYANKFGSGVQPNEHAEKVAIQPLSQRDVSRRKAG